MTSCMKKMTAGLLMAIAIVFAAGFGMQAHAASSNTINGLAAYMRTQNSSLSVSKSRQLAQTYVKYANQNNVSARVLMAMSQCESRFTERAYNPAGYYGIMQTTAQLGRTFGGVSANKLFNAKYSIKTGSAYLAYNLRYFKGNYTKAITGYCAGTGAAARGASTRPAKVRLAVKSNIDRYMSSHGYDD